MDDIIIRKGRSGSPGYAVGKLYIYKRDPYHAPRKTVQDAEAEYLNPVRILTSTVRRSDTDTDVLPVRTAGPIPKGLLSEGIKKIKTVTVTPPVAIHEVIIADFMGTGVDLISEKTI